MQFQSAAKNMKRKFIGLYSFTLLSIFVCIGNTAFAQVQTCTAKVNTQLSPDEMKAMSKLSMADAEAIAIKAVGKDRLKKIESSELEVEDACLVYSFDIKLIAVKGVREVMIDAVTGNIISNKHETPKQEALEKAADKKK